MALWTGSVRIRVKHMTSLFSRRVLYFVPRNKNVTKLCTFYVSLFWQELSGVCLRGEPVWAHWCGGCIQQFCIRIFIFFLDHRIIFSSCLLLPHSFTSSPPSSPSESSSISSFPFHYYMLPLPPSLRLFSFLFCRFSSHLFNFSYSIPYFFS